MNTHELRNEKRLRVRDLPKEYGSFGVLMPHGIEVQVTTTNASLNGFGFYSTLPPDDFIVGCRLVLFPLGSDIPVYGDIVHSSITDKGTRVGVRLQHLGGYAHYTTVIQKLLDSQES